MFLSIVDFEHVYTSVVIGLLLDALVIFCKSLQSTFKTFLDSVISLELLYNILGTNWLLKLKKLRGFILGRAHYLEWVRFIKAVKRRTSESQSKKLLLKIGSKLLCAQNDVLVRIKKIKLKIERVVNAFGLRLSFRMNKGRF